jgi:hypothetical protein
MTGIEIGIDGIDLGRRAEMIGIERGGVGEGREMAGGEEMTEMGSEEAEEMIGIEMRIDVAGEEKRGGIDGVSLHICWEG